MEQAEVFLKSEGNAWLKRNTDKIPIKGDLVLKALDQLIGGLGKDSAVLEIGCSNGWRLKEIKKRYGCAELTGIDPSAEAIRQAKANGVSAYRGLAHSLPFPSNCYDVVIMGFMLYLVDRQNLFQVTTEADRVLVDGGLMVVYDFNPTLPCKNKYKHKEELWSYKQDYDQMFLCNPAYSKVISIIHPDGQTKATVMRKNIERGWPLCE